MARPQPFFRNLIALVLLGVLAVVFASLGAWQLDRAAERDAIKAAIAGGRGSAPLKLSPDTPPEQLVPWRPAAASGTWRHDLTVLLENRNLHGRPGYWVATPLVLGGSDSAVLVLRGWLPRPMAQGERLPEIPAIAQEQTVPGELLERVPRLYELQSWFGDENISLPARLPDPANPLPVLQNLAVEDYAKATGLAFIPAVLAQTGDATPSIAGGNGATTPLVREWPEPSLDSDKNRGYALQWYGFAAIAAIAWLVIAWRSLRPRRRPTPK